MQNEEKIERILNSAKSIKAAEPNPYLFNKIVVRIKEKANETYQTNPILVWASISVLALLISVNLYVISNGSSNSSTNDISNVADAYGLNNHGGLNYE